MGGWNRGIVGLTVCVLALAYLLWSDPGWASTRVALVVGNGGYVTGSCSAGAVENILN